ncbi:MAG: glycosyltransferase [Actinomycetota bacterium]|nr:glycosyltransferase [Actinomycetota bacterium]
MAPATPEVSVVVTTRNRAEQLAELLGGLRNQSLGMTRFELIVVNDASTDDTTKVLNAELSRGELTLTVLNRSACGGARAGREQGWRHARRRGRGDDPRLAGAGRLPGLAKALANGSRSSAARC